MAGFKHQPTAWKERIAYGALDMSPTYAAVYSVILPKAAQVVDPYHVVSLANRSLDKCAAESRTNRRVIEAEKTTRSIGLGDALLTGEEKLDEKGRCALSVVARTR